MVRTMDASRPAGASAASITLWLSAPLILGFAAWGLAAPDAMRASAAAATSWVLGRFGWAILAMASAALVLLAGLALSPWGRLRLGHPDDRPAYSTLSWAAMLFAAGMGTGLVVWGVAEPLTHATAPPGTASGSALPLTFLHWGIHAWAIYAAAALPVAWFAWGRGRPLLVSASFARSGRVVAGGIDALAVVAVTFGLGGTLAMGVLALGSALRLLGLAVPAPGAAFGVATLLALGGIAILSALSGIGRGIRLLSKANLLLAIALMAGVLLFGPTAGLLGGWVEALAGYARLLVPASLMLAPHGDPQWARDWTLTYFLWWLAWGPFVGVFIARISRGRTVRQFVAGVVLLPAIGSTLWFAILGGAGLALLEGGGPAAEALRKASAAEPTAALTILLGTLPLGQLWGALAVVILILFLVTSIDSAIFVLGMMTSGGAPDAPLLLRLFWGMALVALALAITLVASVETARAMAILGALPYPLVLAAQTIALVAALRRVRP